MNFRRIRCLFGHKGGPGTRVGDVVFARCVKCKDPVIRTMGGRWYAQPDEFDPSKRTPSEIGPQGADKLIRRARAEAPFLHRLRRRRVRAMDTYFW